MFTRGNMALRPAISGLMFMLAVAIGIGNALAQVPQYAGTWTGNVDAGADKTRRPIVFVHGLLSSGQTYERAALLFASNGYPATWITAYDYSTVPPITGLGEMEPLDRLIDAVRARTGFDKVDLVGHSMGTEQCRTYLLDPARAAKVARYASLGGGGGAGDVGGVPTIAVGSRSDSIMGPGAGPEGAGHVVLDTPDHIGVATGSEAFAAVYTFINGGQQPKTTTVTPQEPIAVGGFAKYYGTNAPAAGATVEIFEVAEQTGRRTDEKPYAIFTVTAEVAWGPFEAKPGQRYEFCLTVPGRGKLHYYREPFLRTDLLMYTLLGNADPAFGKRLTEAIAADESASMLVVSSLNGAVAAGRDSLKVNGLEIATPAIAPKSETKAVFYIFDANHNKTSDRDRPNDPAFAGWFIAGADIYIPADTPSSVKIEYNGRTLNVPNWKAKSEGMIYVQFD